MGNSKTIQNLIRKYTNKLNCFIKLCLRDIRNLNIVRKNL